MKLPEYAPSASDRVSTREELFEVLEMLGGFEEPQDSEMESACDPFTCLDTDPTIMAADNLEANAITNADLRVRILGRLIQLTILNPPERERRLASCRKLCL